MQNFIPTRKLLVGVCLLMVSVGVKCIRLTVMEQEQFMEMISKQTDQMFKESMNCPPEASDDVKKCLRAEAKKDFADGCKIMKSVWSCLRDAVFKCEDGVETWKFTAPLLDTVARMLNCTDVQFSNTIPPEAPALTAASGSKGSSLILIFGILITAVVCLILGYLLGVAKMQRSAADLENPDTSGERESLRPQQYGN